MANRIGDLTAGTPAATAEFLFSITGSGGSRKVTLANLFLAPTAITVTPPANGTAYTVASATHTTSAPVFNGAQTWNNGATTFIGWDFQITDTASGASSLPFRIRGGAAGTTVLFTLSKAGGADFASLIRGNGGVIDNSNVGFYSDGNTSPGYVLGASRDTNLSRISAGLAAIGTGAQGSFAGSLKLTDIFTNNATYFHRTNTTLTDGAAAQAGTLLNAPVAGNPTKWISIDDNGTPRYIPAW